jgi:hypothetical protein
MKKDGVKKRRRYAASKNEKRKVGSHLGQMCQVQRVDVGLSTAV